MKKINKAVLAILASTVSMTGFALPAMASSETSANVAVSSMYLWRGMNLSPDGGVVSGGLDVAYESGLYAGMWTSSESGGHETDLYVGFSGAAGELSYDITYIHYLYPEDGKMSEFDISELGLSLGYDNITASAFFSIDDEIEGVSDDWAYISVGADFDKYNVTVGKWLNTEGNDFTHLAASFNATDELSFTVSIAAEDEVNVDEDPLVAVTYTKTFDLK